MLKGLMDFFTPSLVSCCILIPLTFRDVLKCNPCAPPSHPLGHHLLISEVSKLSKSDIAIVHAPISSTADNDVSVRSGGKWVRKFLKSTFHKENNLSNVEAGYIIDLDFSERILSNSINLYDFGDIYFNPKTDTQNTVGQRLSFICQNVASRHSKLIVLGGDHSQSYFTIGSLEQVYPKLGIIHFDAHSDLYTSGNSLDKEMNHANVFHWINGMDHVKSILQIGLRDTYFQTDSNIRVVKSKKIQQFSAFEIMSNGFSRLLDSLDSDLDWFISFDVDVLHRVDLPETATPVLGGLDFYTTFRIFEELFQRLRIIGMEVVEIGEGTPTAHGAAAIASRLISRFIFSTHNKESSKGIIFQPTLN
ncbi:arginase family protein [Endozoicomonas arenosclerae]|uniref:arginase family protein n=1 Tax=Endozoicomonas arenosclerae TaxID=1633495 RepID=UPI0007848D17|nr:arginase family protein [Endozoicomonas arenosclerae]